MKLGLYTHPKYKKIMLFIMGFTLPEIKTPIPRMQEMKFNHL